MEILHYSIDAEALEGNLKCTLHHMLHCISVNPDPLHADIYIYGTTPLN